MATSIHEALLQIKGDLGRLLNKSLIDEAALQCGHVWQERVLDPIVTIHLFVLQILHGNTACSHLQHLTQKQFSPSAYCQARTRCERSVNLSITHIFSQAEAEVYVG
jgi:hypothetical protein